SSDVRATPSCGAKGMAHRAPISLLSCRDVTWSGRRRGCLGVVHCMRSAAMGPRARACGQGPYGAASKGAKARLQRIEWPAPTQAVELGQLLPPGVATFVCTFGVSDPVVLTINAIHLTGQAPTTVARRPTRGRTDGMWRGAWKGLGKRLG